MQKGAKSIGRLLRWRVIWRAFALAVMALVMLAMVAYLIELMGTGIWTADWR